MNTRVQPGLSAAAEKRRTPRMDTITLRNREVPVVHEDIDQSKLRFYEANPRIYSMLRKDGGTTNQEEIQARLLSMDHVKELIQDIRRNGGLIEPILVRRGTFEVLEGNCRLAAYRALYEKEPLKWAKVRCILLPEGLPDSLTFALLAQLHVKGKKDWAPFEQAGFLYRRFHDQQIDLPTLAGETGLSQKRVKQLIDTYDFMLKSGEADITHWSHYEEYLKSRAIQKTREKYPSFDRTVVDLIQKAPQFKAVDVRDRLPKICVGPARALKRFAEGNMSFEDSYEIALESGADNNALRRLNKFRQWIAEQDTAKTLAEAEGQDADKIKYELDKIAARTAWLQKMLSKSGKARWS
jgi:hypothetical protein